MAYKRIIVGDQEIKVPVLSIGGFSIFGILLGLWLLTGIYVVGPDAVSYTHLTLPTNREV